MKRFLLVILSLLALGGVLSMVAAETPIAGLERVTIDGVEILPGVPLSDSRPLIGVDGQPVRMEVVAWDLAGNRLMTVNFEKPLVTWVSVTVPIFDQPPCVFELRFNCPPLFADVNRNGIVNATDMGMIKAHIGKSAADEAARVCDLNRDGVVSATDLALCKAVIGDGI